MATAKELISWAASQIGVKESPAGSNRVKYWDTYKANTGVNLQGNPWCAAFVSCGMWHVGLWPKGKDEARFRYCPSLVNWAKANGTWVDRSKAPKAGDIVLFANKGTACHVGFVEKVVNSSTIQTIEGNTSVTSNDNGGSVMRRTRAYGTVGSSWYVLGFVRPKFSGTSSTSSTGTATGAKAVTAALVEEVKNGKWGNEPQRSAKLKAAGYDPVAVQAAVNASYGQKPASDSKVGKYRITTPSGVNVRSKASANATKVDAYAKGKEVTVTQVYASGSDLWGKTDKGWFAIKYGGSTYAVKI